VVDPCVLCNFYEVTIHQVIVLADDDTAGVETLFRLTQVRPDGNITAGTFHIHASTGEAFQIRASGRWTVTCGEPETGFLPLQSAVASGMGSVDIGNFYTFLTKMGYGYTGLFH
jgi:hypothetical protein